MQLVASETGAGFADVFRPSLQLFESSDKQLTLDSVHLNKAGNTFVALEAARALRTAVVQRGEE